MLRRTLPPLIAAAAAAGCAAPAPPPALHGRVLRVADGDTVHVRVHGRDEAVRLIGVDTPEVTPPAQCLAARAARVTGRLLDGERVRLQPDRERRDRYGRLLAYVSRARDGLDVGAELLRRGYARPLVVEPNVRRRGAYAALARTARRHRRGLWAACGADD